MPAQQAPSGHSGGDQGEDLRLVPQQGEIRDRFAAVGEHHSQIDRDPPGSVTGAPWPKPTQRVCERARQASDIGEIGQQAGTGMADHPPAVGPRRRAWDATRWCARRKCLLAVVTEALDEPQRQFSLT